ncbi:phosphatidate cytidylyltransferase [bacterium]|nr:phosphatidate cytidylyltransferase [bacterium]
MLSAIDPVVKYSLIGIFAVLIISSAITYFLTKQNPEKDYHELASRIKTWWIMVAVFSVAIALNKTISIVFFALISFLALKEYLSLIPTRRADHRVLFWAYLAIPIQYYFIGIEWYGMFAIFIPVYVFLFLPFRAVTIGETSGYLNAMATLHWGLMVTVYCISHVGFLLVLPPDGAGQVGGAGLVLFLVVLTQLNDVAQYVSGKMFGKTPIIPKVSPKKTWEGFSGGVLTTTVLATVLSTFLTPLSPSEGAIAGLIIAGFGFIGDVTISAIKRDLGIKDSGTLLPGHGGILDRIDSLTYTAPLFFHYIRYLYY